MGVRHDRSVRLMVACAVVDRHVAQVDDYLAEKSALGDVVRELAQRHGFHDCEVGINTADADRSALSTATLATVRARANGV